MPVPRIALAVLPCSSSSMPIRTVSRQPIASLLDTYPLPMHIATPAPLSDVTNWYQDARKARSAGDVRGTLTILDRILAHDPKHVGALYLRGVIAFESNQLEAAQDSIQRAIDIEPDANSFNLLHIIQVRSGNSERAIQTALQGLALHPHSTALLQSMAFTLRRMGRWEEAAIHSRQLLELQPNDATAHNDLGLTLEAMGEFDDQVRHIRTAVSLAPNHLEFRANLAHALLAAGRYKEAWPYYEDRWANGMLPDGSRDSSRPQIPLPQWKGEQPVTAFARKNKGRRQGRLLVTYEQGFGHLSAVGARAFFENHLRLSSAFVALIRRVVMLALARHRIDCRDTERPERLGLVLPVDVSASGIQHSARNHSGKSSVSVCRSETGCAMARETRRAAELRTAPCGYRMGRRQCELTN
jgi:Flp pilus assembly protein TadD